MKRHGPTAGTPLVVSVLMLVAITAPLAFAADWDSGRTYYYPGVTEPGTRGAGGQAGYGTGSFRPREPSEGRPPTWAGGGSPYEWAPDRPAATESPAWGGVAPGQWSESRPVQPQPPSQYRFRPVPEDKSRPQDDAPRFRPDADLARRSQRYWGVPGQEPSQFGGGPAAIFRPLREEAEGTRAEPPPPALPEYPPWGGPGAGYFPY
jgi:hypothetical protein